MKKIKALKNKPIAKPKLSSKSRYLMKTSAFSSNVELMITKKVVPCQQLKSVKVKDEVDEN